MDHKTPWLVSVEEGDFSRDATYRIWDATDRWIFECRYGKRELIKHAVYCVNTHDALVAACEAALETMDLFNIHGDVVAQLRSALAKAKEAAL